VPLAPRSEIDLHAGWRLARILKELAPEVVHAHDAHGVALASLALSLGRLDAEPLLIASRRVDFHLQGSSFSRWKYRQVDCFIAASEAIRVMLIGDGIEADRIVTVHEGIDIDRVTAEPAAAIHAELWLPTHAPLVGNVAALVPHKGQRHLIEAAALVVREVPDARFIIMGEGELRQALEKQIKDLHLEKHVILTGFRPDVLAFHKGFDLFVMSSVTEGLGTSLLDAMASAKAIVATATGGIPEVVVEGVTGLLVPPRDHHAMAAAIIRLLRDPGLREQMGRAGFERVRTRFSAARMVEETVGVYRARQAASPGGAHPDDRVRAKDTPSRPPAD
jgi:glycosyltransferase involved in cell wall biosynthesis